MNRVGFVLKSRGWRNTVERAVSVGQRFGLRQAPYVEHLTHFAHCMQEVDARPSFPISTTLLERYPELAGCLKSLPADFLSHGHTHVNYTRIPRHEQQRLIQKSREILSQGGFDVSGFRAPYLHWDSDLIQTLAQNKFQFDSSAIAWWPLEQFISLTPMQKDAYEKARQFYEPYLNPAKHPAIPYFHENGVLEIPVTLPDDEILIDRLGITNPAACGQVWLGILEKTHQAEGLFNLQLHPERIFVMEEALERLLQTVRSKFPDIWLTHLPEINRWWRQKSPLRAAPWPDGYRSALCVTGDIDCVTLQDFLWRFIE